MIPNKEKALLRTQIIGYYEIDRISNEIARATSRPAGESQLLHFCPRIANSFIKELSIYLGSADYKYFEINFKVSDELTTFNKCFTKFKGYLPEDQAYLCGLINVLDSILPLDQTIKDTIKHWIPDVFFISDDIKKFKDTKDYNALIVRVVEADKNGSPNVLWDLFVYFKEIQKFDLALEVLKKFSDDNLHYQDAMLELANLQAVAPMDLSLDNTNNESQKVAVLDSLLKSKSQEDCARYLHDLMGGTGPAPQWLKETPFDNVPLLLVRMAEQYKTKVVTNAPEQKASPRANPSRLFNGNANAAATPMSLDNTPRLK